MSVVCVYENSENKIYERERERERERDTVCLAMNLGEDGGGEKNFFPGIQEAKDKSRKQGFRKEHKNLRTERERELRD